MLKQFVRDEEWLTINGYPNYKISSSGRIKSISKTVPLRKNWRDI